MRTLTLDPTTTLGSLPLYAVGLAELVTRPWRYKGYFKLARWCGQLTPANQQCTVELAPDAHFQFLTADPYWNRLIAKRYHYERATGLVLRHLADVDYAFIDAGANYGYWSVLVTSETYGAKPTVAIEPVTRTFRALQDNCALNGNRFVPLQLAITAETGECVLIHYSRSAIGANASASVVQRSESANEMDSESVESISLDELLLKHVPAVCPVVLKLDVEGMEVPALCGATSLEQREWLVIYEDHGNDVACVASEFVMGLDANIFAVTRRGEVSRVDTLDDVRRIKTNRGRGYNFFAASRNGVFEQRLAEFAPLEGKPLSRGVMPAIR